MTSTPTAQREEGTVLLREKGRLHGAEQKGKREHAPSRNQSGLPGEGGPFLDEIRNRKGNMEVRIEGGGGGAALSAARSQAPRPTFWGKVGDRVPLGASDVRTGGSREERQNRGQGRGGGWQCGETEQGRGAARMAERGRVPASPHA